MTRWIAAAAAALLAGCAQNAILELTVQVPTATDVGAPGARFAVLNFANTRDSLTGTFPGSATGTEEAIPLPADATEEVRISVIGDERLDRALFVAVRYCVSETCSNVSPIDPNLDLRQLRVVRYERAFWPGEYSQHTLPLGPLTAGEILEIDKCDVFACREGTALSACEGDLHFCEL